MRWYASSPWMQRAADTTGISLVFHIPLSYQDPLKGKWSNAGQQSERIASEKSSVHGMARPTISAQIPFSQDGLLLIGWTPEANISLGSTQINSRELIQDTSTLSRLRIDATLYSSAHLEASWSTLLLGYRIIARPDLFISFEIMRHAAAIATSGSSRGRTQVTLQSQGASGIPQEWETVETTFEEEQFQSTWKGQYSGSAWGAKMQAHLGPLYYSGQMGVDLDLQGSYSLQETLPFFVDSLTLAQGSDSAGAWSEPSMRDPLLRDSIYSSSYESHTDMILQIPQIHTFGIQFTSWGVIEYTLVRSAFALATEPDSIKSALDLRSRIGNIIQPQHIGMVHLLFSHVGAAIGAMWIDKSLLGILSLSGFTDSSPVALSAQIDALPWLRVYLGVNYAL
jgi:hypothetical protein